MTATTFPRVFENAREELLSSDVNRSSQLGSTALQDELLNDSIDSNGVPISHYTRVPSISGVAGGFTVTISSGEALQYDASISDADSSQMSVLQWPQQNVLVATPDPSSGRVDVLYAVPAMVGSDPSVRNILQDPTTRAFGPATVMKTQRPTATLGIATGTPAGTPTPPSVPSGALALAEIYVPAAAPDSTTFGFTPRLSRRTLFPFTGGQQGSPMCGVIRGCTPGQKVVVGVVAWSEVATDDNMCVVDGQIFEFRRAGLIGTPDTLANPFASAAPALSSRPFFIYLAGGRSLPQAGSSTSPLILIESTTPPDPASGRPTAALGTPRGNTMSALCIGAAFVKFGSVNRQVLAWADEGRWVQGRTEVLEEQIGAAGATVTLASAPATAEIAKVHVFAADDGTPGIVTVGNESVPTRAPRSVDVPISSKTFPQAFDAHGTSTSPLVLGYRIPIRRV
jgi:hypothetical protein